MFFSQIACNWGTFSRSVGLLHRPAGAFVLIQTTFTQDQWEYLTICGANVPEAALNWDKVEVRAASVCNVGTTKELNTDLLFPLN